MTDLSIMANSQDRILNSIKINNVTQCWEWVKNRPNKGGYVNLNIKSSSGNYITISAHRYSYISHNGDIPQGLFVCHSCDNPLCVNPQHLWLGTAKDNSRDKNDKGRQTYQRGSEMHNAILTEDIVLKMRERIRDGAARKAILTEFNIPIHIYKDIKHNRNWKHVTLTNANHPNQTT